MSKRVLYRQDIMNIYESHLKDLLTRCCKRHEVIHPLRMDYHVAGELVILAVPKPECLDALRDLNKAWGHARQTNQFPSAEVVLTSDTGSGFKVVIYFVGDQNYGVELMRLTGPYEFWSYVGKFLKQQGIEYDAKRLWREGQPLDTAEEEVVFKLAKLKPIAPKDRIKVKFAAGQEGSLPLTPS